VSEPPAGKAASVRVGRFHGEAAVTLAAGELEATFLPGLGLLGASLRHRGEELLALPGGVDGYRAGHVTGLPILAPWANRLAGRRFRTAGVEVDLEGVALHTDPGGLPIHGTLTAHPGWRLELLAAEDERAVLRASFDYGAWPELLAAFPFPHELVVEAAVAGATLAVTTTLRAGARRPVPVAFGWHPYLRLPGPPRSAWRLLLPEREHLALDGRGLPTGLADHEPAEAEAVGERAFDDLYALGPERTLGLEAGGRRLLVDYGDGYRYAQVFAPPGGEFVCLEPMTVSTNALGAGTCPLVEPGGAFTAAFALRVEEASG
jgi:aldose 1-epimerase